MKKIFQETKSKTFMRKNEELCFCKSVEVQKKSLIKILLQVIFQKC